MTLEQIKQQEIEKIKLEIDRTEDALIYWMHGLLQDSIAEVGDRHIKLTDKQLQKITERLIGNLTFDLDVFDHLSSQVKELETLYKDLAYLKH